MFAPLYIIHCLCAADGQAEKISVRLSLIKSIENFTALCFGDQTKIDSIKKKSWLGVCAFDIYQFNCLAKRCIFFQYAFINNHRLSAFQYDLNTKHKVHIQYNPPFFVKISSQREMAFPIGTWPNFLLYIYIYIRRRKVVYAHVVEIEIHSSSLIASIWQRKALRMHYTH